MTTERELPAKTEDAIEIRRSSVLPRVHVVPSVELLSPAAPEPKPQPMPQPEPAAPGPDRAVAPATAPSSAVVPRHRRVRKALASAPRRRKKPVLLGGLAAAVLIAAPLLVINARSRPDRDPASSAANSLPDARKPVAPVPTWAGSPSATSSASPSPSPSPSPSASDRRVPGGKPPNESVTGGTPRTVVTGRRGAAAKQQKTVHTDSVARPSHLLAGYASNLCIGVVGGKPASKAHLVTWNCNSASYEKWTFEPDGTIRAMGMCMDVAWGSVDNGATIQLEYCHGAQAQHFTLYSNGDLVNARSGKCVSVKGQRTSRGTGLEQWGCVGSSSQKWRVA